MGAQGLEAMDHFWKYQEVIFGRMNFKSEFNLVIRLMILGSEMGPWRKNPMILHDQLNFPQNLILLWGPQETLFSGAPPRTPLLLITAGLSWDCFLGLAN